MAETVVINFTGKDDISSVAKDVEKSIKDVGTTAEAQGSKFDGMKEIARGAFQSIGSFAVNAAAEIGSNIVGGVTDFFSSAVRGSMDYQNVLAQTEAVIESTGGAAGYSVQQMEEMARSMSAAEGMSLFPDDAILSAQNVLATFTKIQGVEFEGATQAALDMAQALGMDLGGAAMMMGKALNDPVKGMSALSRSGVSFTEEQKALVEEMVAVGDVAGAQQLILKEMEVQFGGSALKATETLEGGMVLLSEGIEDAKGAIGDALLPILTRFTNFGLTMLVPMLKDVLGAFGAWITSIDWDTIIGAVGGMIQGFTGMVSGIDWASLFTSLNAVGNLFMAYLPMAMETIQPTIDLVKTLFYGLINLLIGPEFMSIYSSVYTVIQAVVEILMNLGNTLRPVIASIIGTVTQVVARIFEVVQSVAAPLSQFIGMVVATLTSPAVIQAFNGVGEVVALVGTIIEKVFSIVANIVLDFVESYWTQLVQAFITIWPVVDFVFQNIMTAVNFAINFIKGILGALILLLNGDTTKAMQKLTETFSTAWENIKKAVMTVVESVKTTISKFVGEVANQATQLGNDIVNGIARGVSNSANAIKDAMKRAIGDAISFAKGILGIASPSKVMAKVVGAPIGQGIASGIMEGIPAIRGAMSVSLGAAQGQATQSIQNYYLTASYQTAQSESSIRNDLRAMQLLSGAV